jgi:tetratricopeptide (TPR) repeat protein
MTKKSWLLAILFIVLPINTLAILEPEDRAQYYIDQYGSADENDERVQRVRQVFDRVKQVADKRHYQLPKLQVIKRSRKKDEPLAIALPDGSIILSQRAIEFFYHNVSPEMGDTRAAFVLGHELAHLAQGHFWHRQFFSLAENSPKLNKMLSSFKEANGIEKETEADDIGFIYAAMAGYPVDKLVVEGPLQQAFWKYWEQQAVRKVLESHPSPTVRAEVLRLRLQDLLSQLPYFQFGVRLAHFNRCDDAVYFFKEFARAFPSHQVYNNLGLCELQQAQLELGEAAYSYWLPSVLDVSSELEDEWYSMSKGEELSTLARNLLNRAKEYFELASDKDTSYLPATLNLVTTMLYLGKIYQARAQIEKARQLAPNDLEIQGWRAVILFEEGKQSLTDMWPDVVDSLEKLAQQPAPPSVLYNMARLLEQRGRTGADEFWQRLAQQADLPRAIRDRVCEKTTCPPPQPNQTAKAHWELPLKLGDRTKRHQTLRQWQKISSRRLYDIREELYQSPNHSAEVLGLNKRIEMVVLKQLEHLSVKDLPAYCGHPLRQRRVVNGTLFSCEHWAALVADEKVKEVWVIKKPHE